MADPVTWTNETRKLSDLIPWPRNPRQIREDQARRLTESLDEFGQVDIIAIGPGGEVYNGHQRLNVWASEHGPDFEVAVRVASRELTEKEREKLVVFLHKGAAGEWDFDTLANEFELDELLAWGFEERDLELDLWHQEPPEDPGPQIDRAEELQEKWQVQRGQVWQVGRHRLMCGDSTSAEDVARLMGGEKAGAVVTDPPYRIEREGILNDDPAGLRDLFDGCLALLPLDGGVIAAFQSPRLFPVWLDAIRAAGHNFERMLWMYKPNDETYPWRGWLQKSEAILLSSKGRGEWLEVHPYAHDCYSPTTLGQELPKDWGKVHASVKPLAVVGDLIARLGGNVYDPFLGSGTTLVGCEQQDRIGWGMELSAAHCAVTLERLTGMGLEARLVT